MKNGTRALAVNVGSSSLKLDVWETGAVQAQLRLEARGIGGEHGTLAENDHVVARRIVADHETALQELLQRVPAAERIARIGHRVVHGGSRYRSSVWLDDGVAEDLQSLVRLSPLHQPPALAVIRACRRRFPGRSGRGGFAARRNAGSPFASPARTGIST